MSHYPNINYDEFFTAATDFLRRNLPAELSHFTTRRNSKNNWIVIEYPNFKYSQYELHLSSHSGNHAVYFGDGPHVVCAFYFKIKKEMADSDAWLETLSTHIEQIQRQLKQRLVFGHWGDNWVWIAVCLDEELSTPENLSSITARFIQATYEPITSAFKAIGR